jgi:hypothetical protein
MKYCIEISSVAEIEFFLPFWRGKKYQRFAFSISDTLHSKRLVKKRSNPTQPNIGNGADGRKPSVSWQLSTAAHLCRYAAAKPL